MHVRRATTRDVETLRDLRMQAMIDAADAFGSTYDREAARTPADWARWIAPGATFLLETSEPGSASGLVAATLVPDTPGVVHLVAMWVRPSLRGSGAAGALVDAVLDWAAAEDASVVRLHVMEGNKRARRLYERHGFRATGAQVQRERDSAIEVEMERPLLRD